MDAIFATIGGGESAGNGDIPLQVIWLPLLFLFLAGLAALACQRMKFSYSIGLVLLGLFVSWWGEAVELPLLSDAHLTENMVLYIFLPALIFEAALGLDVRSLRRNFAPIILLAAPGVIFATFVTGVLVHWVTPLDWGQSFIFGALISTTDPVAVIAKFRELKAPERLTMIVDGESLFNDATAIVMFGIVVEIVSDGGDLAAGTLVLAVLRFFWVFAGGFLVGLAAGAVGCLFIRLGRNMERGLRRVLRVLFSICVAYGAFLLAQGLLGLSGVMASVGAGMVMSYWVRTRESDRSLYHLREYWNIAAFFGNSLIFLALGLTERYLMGRYRLWEWLEPALLVCLAVLLARWLLVYGFVPLSNRLPGQEPIGSGYKAVMVWGGIRGALPVGLAVSLKPSDLGVAPEAAADASRGLIILFTVTVVVFTLVAQGLSIRPLMRHYGLVESRQPPHPSDAPPGTN